MIKKILANLGLTSQEAVLADILKKENNSDPPTPEEVSQLSPDNIDSGEFWEECIRINPLAICGDKRILEHWSVDLVKRQNRLFGVSLGIHNQYAMKKMCGNEKLKCLEIGPGYGQLAEMFKIHEDDYIAIDVNPLTEGVIKCGGRTIPIDDEFDFIVSSNVFQHLSIEQRRSYYREAYKKLKPNGIFSVTNVVDSGNPKARRLNGRGLSYHTGQYTEIQTRKEILDDLTEARLQIASITENPAATCFQCYKPA